MASPSLDALQALSTNAQAPGGLVQGALARKRLLDELKRNLQLQGPHSISGAVPEDVAQLQDSEDESPYFGKDEQARIGGIQKTNQDVQTFNRPDVSAMTAKQLADKIGLSIAPAKQAGENAIALQKQKAADEAKAAALQPQQEAEAYRVMNTANDGAASEGLPKSTLVPSFDAKGRMLLKTQPTPPQQLSQQHGAQVGLQEIPALRGMINTLSPNLGPVAGRLNSAASGLGLDTLFHDPKTAQALNDFKSQLSLLKSNVAMVHGGARGGSNVGMAQRFDQLMNMNQTPSALHGSLDAFERWLTKYASAKSSADLDAADAELGLPGSEPSPAVGRANDPLGIR